MPPSSIFTFGDVVEQGGRRVFLLTPAYFSGERVSMPLQLFHFTQRRRRFIHVCRQVHHHADPVFEDLEFGTEVLRRIVAVRLAVLDRFVGQRLDESRRALIVNDLAQHRHFEQGALGRRKFLWRYKSPTGLIGVSRLSGAGDRTEKPHRSEGTQCVELFFVAHEQTAGETQPVHRNAAAVLRGPWH